MSVCTCAASAAGASFPAHARRVSVSSRGGTERAQPRWRLACVSKAKASFAQKVHRPTLFACRAESRTGVSFASSTGPVGDPTTGETAVDAAARLNREALEAKTRVALAETRARLEGQKQIQQKASQVEDELRRRELGARVAEEVGGRRPTQRMALPIALAGVQCSLMGVGALLLTEKAIVELTERNLDAATHVANKTLIVNLLVSGGVGATALLTISSIILFMVAWKEGHGVVTNTPVTYYRCDGSGRECCRNGPHDLGYAKKFVYLKNGKGFETRQKDSMRRHLLVSKQCNPLKPVVLYPKQEGWKLW